MDFSLKVQQIKKAYTEVKLFRSRHQILHAFVLETKSTPFY